MRILIAEDDQVLADGLLRSLRGSGYAVDQVSSGTEADAALASHEFDLLILDLGLPRLHGLEVLRKLRARGSTLPVLILTAADSVDQRVKGLDLGADDFMAKPFSLQELEARVRALTRRGLGTASSVIRHGPLTFDATGRVAYINDQMIELSAREISLLEVLLQRAGRLVSKDQLVTRLCEWGEEVEQQRDRGVHPPAAQEDRAGPDPHRHRARAGLLPGEDRRLAASAGKACERFALPRHDVRSVCPGRNATARSSCSRHEAHFRARGNRAGPRTLACDANPKALEMNADAWNQLADRSRVLVHHVSRLMGVLTQPTSSRHDHDVRDRMLRPIAAEATVALEGLLAQMAGTPELAAHARILQRFDLSLAAWRRSVGEASPLVARYQTALLQQAAQVLTSCLHVASLSTSESDRVFLTRGDLTGRAGPPPP